MLLSITSVLIGRCPIACNLADNQSGETPFSDRVPINENRQSGVVTLINNTAPKWWGWLNRIGLDDPEPAARSRAIPPRRGNQAIGVIAISITGSIEPLSPTLTRGTNDNSFWQFNNAIVIIRQFQLSQRTHHTATSTPRILAFPKTMPLAGITAPSLARIPWPARALGAPQTRFSFSPTTLNRTVFQPVSIRMLFS